MKLRLLPLMTIALLTGCGGPQLEQGGGVFITRSGCPIVGIPAGTGDITIFNPPGSRDSAAIDVTASITNVISNCDDTSGDRLLSNVGFDVVAVRRDAGPARQVVLPFFDVVTQGGTQIVAKRVGYVALNFQAGSVRAQTRTQAVARISRSAAALPDEVRRALNARRKPGDPSAAVDPMSDPATRAAVARATFEHLVGFQMSQESLRYNTTR